MVVAAELDTASSLLVDRFPDLAAEWADSNTLGLATITWQSNRKGDWVCAEGHHWTRSVQGRINLPTRTARSCPTCRLERRSLANIHPDVAAQWHSDNDRSVDEVSYASTYEALWGCESGHLWTAKVNTRTAMKTGCPYCAPNGRALAGFNDLASRFPDIAREWDAEKNEVGPYTVRPSSDKIVWWVCPIGHSYDMKVDLRVRQGNACPICSGRCVLAGFSDLATLRPELVSEWSDRNELDPTEVTVSSGRSAEWVCTEGHRWTCIVSGRTSRRSATRCPRCWHGRQSVIETMFWNGLRDNHGFRDLLEGERTPVTWGRARFSEVDTMLPDARVVIEYDGWYWHKNLRKVDLDRIKTTALLDAGWSVIRIREHPLSSLGLRHDQYFEIPFVQTYRAAAVDVAVAELASLLNRLDG